MISDRTLKKISNRVSPDPVERQRIIDESFKRLNIRLLQQSQKLTDEVLNKRCTL